MSFVFVCDKSSKVQSQASIRLVQPAAVSCLSRTTGMLCVQGLGPHKLIRELVEIPVRLHGPPRLQGQIVHELKIHRTNKKVVQYHCIIIPWSG